MIAQVALWIKTSVKHSDGLSLHHRAHLGNRKVCPLTLARRLTFSQGDGLFVGLHGLRIIWAQKREQSEFYFNSLYFWIYFPPARQRWLPQQSSGLLTVGLDYVWTQSLILSKTQLMRREMKSALSHSVFVVIWGTFTPLSSLFLPPHSVQVL